MDLKEAIKVFQCGGLVSARLEPVPVMGEGDQYLMVLTPKTGKEIILMMRNFHHRNDPRYFKSENAGAAAAKKIGFREITIKIR